MSTNQQNQAPWTACTCPACQGDEPEHAIIQTTCGRSGDAIRLRVPFSTRYDSAGWGDRPRRKWKGTQGEDLEGYLESSGSQGITVRSADGTLHRVDHGKYAPLDGGTLARRAVVRLTGAASRATRHLHKAAPKAGQRWITVHPNGPDEKGVPILISDNKDGTWSVVAGAGGRLHHLKLHNVKTEEEAAAEKAMSAKERRAKEKERKKAQTPEQKGDEKKAKKDVEAARLMAERQFIDSVRKRLGGVSEDIDERKLHGLSDGAKSLILTRHHKKQLAEAQRRKDEVARKLVEHVVEERGAEKKVEAAAAEAQVVPVAQDLAQEELDLQAQEDKERQEDREALVQQPEPQELPQEVPPEQAEAAGMAQEELGERAKEKEREQAERRLMRQRHVVGKSDVGERAAQAVAERIQKTGDVSGQINMVGGRDDDPNRPVLTVGQKASEEVERRGLQALQDAQVLAAVATGKVEAIPEALKPAQERIVKKALERLQVPVPEKVEEALSDEAVKEALAKEAARKLRRSEILKARSERFKEMEAKGGEDSDEEGGEGKAQLCLAYSDMLGNIAGAASAAKRAGLLETEKVPVTEAEMSEIKAVLQDAATLRKQQAEFRAMNQEVERGNYGRAREAHKVTVHASPQDVELSVEEEVRRHLAETLRGVAARSRPAFMQSATGAHYDVLADVGLSIGSQRYLDRATVDAIGPANAALLLRHALEADGHKTRDVLDALEAHHVKQLEPVTQKALDQAERHVPGLTATVQEVGDIEAAMGQIGASKEGIEDAQREIGSALGRLEATASLAQAFRGKVPDSMTVKGETGQLDTTLQWLHSIGLTDPKRDYRVDYKAGEVTIPREAWGRLVQKVPADQLALRKEALAIKAGQQDEEGWLPKGIVHRAASTFTDPLPTAPVYRRALNQQHPNTREAIEEHVGLRLADGEQPGDIMHDLLAPAVVNGSRNPSEHTAAVKELFPTMKPGGKERLEAKLAELGPRPDAGISMFTPPEERRKLEAAQVEWSKAYHAAEDAERVPLSYHREHWQRLAEAAVGKRYGPEARAFHAQSIDVDNPKTVEAAFRTLAAHPETAVAFVPTGQLTPRHASQLRDYFYQRMGLDPKDKERRDAYEAAMAGLGPRPKGAQVSMFGGGDTAGPEQAAWDARRDAILEKYPRAGVEEKIKALGENPDPEQVKQIRREAADAPTPWGQYVEAHGDLVHAQAALQDELRSRFLEKFTEHHGRLTGSALKRGTMEVTNQERHVKATGTEEEVAEFNRKKAERMEALRVKQGGKYASMGGEGSLERAYTEALRGDSIERQNQVGLFGSTGGGGGEQGGLFGAPDPGQGSLFGTAQPPEPNRPEKKPERGERWTIGERAENELGSLVQHLGRQFKPGEKVDLPRGLNMDGPRVHQQRVIKTLSKSRRLLAALGTGSGKSLVSIGAFTHEHAQGNATHAVFVTPSAVQDQFGGEVARFTDPGKYRWAVGSDLHSYEERLAALRDDSIHMKVMTHEAFRDTMLRMMADHHRGGDIEAMKKDLGKATAKTRAEWMRQAADAHGIKPWFFYGDEAHRFTHREGEPTGLHSVMSAASHPTNSTHALFGTATPHKNDEAEVYSMASMVDPDTYADRTAFMQAFGADMAQNHQAVRRELAHAIYTARVDPEGVERYDSENPQIVDGKKVATGTPIPLNPQHQAHVDRVGELYERARKAWRSSKTPDVEAIRELSPTSFEGQPPERHEAIARRLAPSLGIIRESATRRAVNQAPAEFNTKLRAMADVVEHDVRKATWTNHRTGKEEKGKPSIIFSDSLGDCEAIHKHLQERGLRSALYHGGLTASEREKVRLGFQPAGGDSPRYDVIVATSAAEAGINLQRAKVVHHYDVPMTEKSFAQRTGRAYRQGQPGDVEVHQWHADHAFEAAGLRRLRRKEALASVFQTPIHNLDETGVAGEYQRVLADKRQADEPTSVEGMAA